MLGALRYMHADICTAPSSTPSPYVQAGRATDQPGQFGPHDEPFQSVAAAASVPMAQRRLQRKLC